MEMIVILLEVTGYDVGEDIMVCGIYMIKNVVDGRIYIGQSKNIHRRFREHIHSKDDSYIDNSIRKHGIRSFMFLIICECDKSELDIEEKKFISLYNTYYDNAHYNLTKGGQKIGKGSFNPRYKNYYRVLKHDKNSYVLVGHHSKRLKYSWNYEYLLMLADKLNNNCISEDDLKQKKEYHITKAGIKNNTQRYVLVSPMNKPICSSYEYHYLLELMDKLNIGEIKEKDIHKKEYHIVKGGFSKNNIQNYTLMSPMGEKLKTTNDKKELTKICYQLNNNLIKEEEINKKSYTIDL